MDGSEAFGKLIGCDNSCVKPVAWMFLCTQPAIYAQNMGGESCGRLRFVATYLDPDKVRAVRFEEKLVPRTQSNEVLIECLREVLLAQQSMPQGEAEAHAMRYPEGLVAPEHRALWDALLASRFVPLVRHLHILGQPPAPVQTLLHGFAAPDDAPKLASASHVEQPSDEVQGKRRVRKSPAQRQVEPA